MRELVVAGLAGLAAVGLTLAGCSGQKTPPEPAGSAPAAAHGSLAECLAAHGVPESGGQSVLLGPPAGVDPATWDSAMKACSSLAPGPAPGPATP